MCAEMDPIVERAVSGKAPILQHTWLNANGNGPGESTPADLVELARRHPDANFICAHAGGDWERGIRIVRPMANISVDVAGFDPTAGMVEMAVRELGAERVLYGSDVGGRSFASQLGKVLGADIPDSAKELMLGGNLRRLFGPFSGERLSRVIYRRQCELSRWPSRRAGGRCDSRFRVSASKMRVTPGMGRSFDGILHKDIAGVNARLAAECRGGLSRAVRLGESYAAQLAGRSAPMPRAVWMPGIRLLPNYHGYKLTDPLFAELLHQAAARRLIVQIAVSMEDMRTQNPLLRVPPVDL